VTTYRRTQWAWWALAFAASIIVLMVVTAVVDSGDELGVWWYVLLGIAAIALVEVSRLTVTVDAEQVSAAFGVGWPRRRIDLSQIVAVNRKRVRWFHGWGIRKVPGGWMYNVSGDDAVEVAVDDGTAFWIGTDDPEGLVAALERRQPSPGV
jgi:hypothetical protein